VGHVIAALTPTQQTKKLMTSCLSVKWQKNETLAAIAQGLGKPEMAY
jgi:hypothetical protein